MSVQLLWLPQSQWAGYYVALDKGFYKEQGLDVTIHPGGPNVTPTSLVASGAANFGGGIGPLDVVTSASKGLKLVEVGQTDQQDYLRLVSLKSLGITDLKQLEGQTVGYFLGTELYSLQALVKDAGGDPSKVKWTIQGTNLAPIKNGDWAAGSATTMNELITLQQEDNVDLNIWDLGAYAFPRNGIATSEDYLKAHPDVVQKFLTATFQGWQYAFEHKDEAVQIVLKNGQGLDQAHQAAQLDAMQEIYCTGPALEKGMGVLDPTVFERGNDFLAANGVIPSKITDVSSTYTSEFMDKVPMDKKSCPSGS